MTSPQTRTASARPLAWPSIHAPYGTPEGSAPVEKVQPDKQRRAPQQEAGTGAMVIGVADAVTGTTITDAYFSTTYGTWGNGWYVVEDFNDGGYIIVGAPGYYWNSFQGIDGATEVVSLNPQFQ